MPGHKPCSLFLYQLYRVFSCSQLGQYDLDFSTSVLSFFTRLSETRATSICPSLPVFQTQENDDWRPIPLLTLVAVDRLTSFGSVRIRRRCTKTQRKQPVRGIESRRHRHFVFCPGLTFTASPCIPWQVARDR